ncbi:hypothetical protein SAMN05444411_102147 [Lutibacter oricola]|uniref:Glycosyltransferase 2-like domain-containing protein n=1 Tax=Lutibacter oricola TaxID=762486 RepID=A0A1H2W9Z8_9FLAO|nr:glycosyltransferase family 2 protein [Lutibacter oricola]SDW77452.1 hypothetical protein SAMN05444411_102147 [Lutibacter oricola]
MKTAIVILNWNGKKLLEKFIPSVITNSKLDNVSIYVADNASTDNSINFLKKNYPEVNIIKNKQNGGFAKGYNIALEQVKEDILCLLNSDVEVTKNWLTPILDTFKKESNTAIIQPKILDFKNKNKFEYAGAGGGFVDKYGYPYCRGRLFNNIENDNNQFNDTTSIFWASGACFFIRNTVYKNLKGFDNQYFAHQEEIDLCWRVQNLGYDIKYIGASTVFHVGGATLKESSPQKTFLNFRNSLFTLVKNLPSKRIIGIIFIRLVLDGVAGIKFLAEFRPKHTWAIIKAHFSFYFYLPQILKKRKALTQKENYYTHKSIVWSHFVQGIKKYNDL